MIRIRITERQFEILKSITRITSALLLVLIFAFLFDVIRIGNIAHKLWAFYSFTLTTLVTSIIYSLSWIFYLLISLGKIHRHPEPPSSELSSPRLMVPILLLILFGFVVFSGNLYLMIYIL